MTPESKPAKTKTSLFGVIMIASSILILSGVYVFQRFDFLNFFLASLGITAEIDPNAYFVVNKSLRLIINDAACLMLIKAIFIEKKYLKVAYIVFAIEVLLLLPLYFCFKLTFEGNSEISSPLLSQIHRLIVNPMLMILVIISFFYQRFKSQSGT